MKLSFPVHPRQKAALKTKATEILYGGAAGGGKMLSLDTPIPTPDGWSTMGELRFGSLVFDENGHPCHVIALSAINPEPNSFRITFDDGSQVDACADHQWLTYTASDLAAISRRNPEFRAARRAARPSRVTGRQSATFTAAISERNATRHAIKDIPSGSIRVTSEIAATLKTTSGRSNHAIPCAGSLNLPDAHLPIPPYTLGVWLGDGTAQQGAVTMHLDDMNGIRQHIEADGFTLSPRTSKFGWGILGLQRLIRQTGLVNNKHVPEIYLRGSSSQRLALLQGLMDTDGHARKSGGCEFTTTDEWLAEAVRELVVSLGWKAGISVGRAMLNGICVGPKWCVNFTPSEKVFRLARKAERQKETRRRTTSFRYIVACEPIQPVPMRCIEVDSTSHLYLVGRSMIPTHNSHLFRVVAIGWCLAIPGLQVYLFRRESPDLWANHMEGPGSFPELLGPLLASKKVKINQSKGFIEFPNKSKIHLCHCQYEKDKYAFQGAEIHVLLMDELTHFTQSIYRYLRARCRIGGLKIPQRFVGMFPRILCGTNPGGPGHNWVKASFVDLASPMTITEMPPKEGGMLRQYIPAKLSDNPTVDAKDYTMKLQGLGDDALVKAMLEGDWDIVAGGMFDDVWRIATHAVPSFDIPHGWRIDRSFDWGSSKPFSVGFWAESDGTEATLWDGTKRSWPRGSLFRIGEIYGWNGNPNEGCKKLAVEVARDIVAFEKVVPWGARVIPGPADNSIYDAENGVCIADDMAKLGIQWERSDKSPGSRKTGWEAMRKMFKSCHKTLMEDPGLFVFDVCRQFIRTVPMLPRDEKKTDDIDTNTEDHTADETRYRVLAVHHTFTSTEFRL